MSKFNIGHKMFALTQKVTELLTTFKKKKKVVGDLMH